jgi:carbamoyl-phosphate synthase small subunit
MTGRRPLALLALADGAVFAGTAFGARGTVTGEVCFNTGMTGYQEVLTDPSYHGQIVAMTAPQIGNTGVNDEDDQSRKPWVAGFVMRDASAAYSSWRATGSLERYLQHHDVTAITDVDTRRLTRHIRTYGAMTGALSSETTNPAELVDVARAAPSLVGRDLAREVTAPRPYGSSFPPAAGVAVKRVVAFDFGLKHNLLEQLAAAGCEVTVVPATTPAETVLGGGYDGVFLSNGPGDPEPVTYATETVARLLGEIPVFGICLGHQILALALGAETFKLPFGHRGSNHPVRCAGVSRVEITCQNHGFAVEPESLSGTPAHITHTNLNDHTVEGLSVKGVCFSVQYHPEAGPGPHDSRYLFKQFRKLMEEFEPSELDRLSV